MGDWEDLAPPRREIGKQAAPPLWRLTLPTEPPLVIDLHGSPGRAGWYLTCRRLYLIQRRLTIAEDASAEAARAAAVVYMLEQLELLYQLVLKWGDMLLPHEPEGKRHE